ncbi:MAG: hypothetical protein IMW94_02045 [Thermoanaerobacter sp.]|nr:hypothetical protein [Thermoanaerobacter sp.]
MKREDPFMLANYRFLPARLKEKVNRFINLLDQPYRDFASKRYAQGKSMAVVAEEMGYAERSLYTFREKVITLWMLYCDHERLEAHKQRMIAMIRRHSPISHSRLLMNMNLKRSGLSIDDFLDLIEILVATGVIDRVLVSRDNGKLARVYYYRGDSQHEFVNSLSCYDKTAIHL